MTRIAYFESYFPSEWECPECGFGNDCTCDAEMYAWFGDERDEAAAAASAEGDSGTETEAEADPGAEDEPGIASH